MNPIKLSNNLKQSLQSYLTTTFDVKRDKTEDALGEEIRKNFEEPEALAKGPFLEITPPYKTGCSLIDLIENGVLSPEFLELAPERLPLPIDAPLYSHQEKAIRKLISDEHNIVVSSGTGSGKTECFLIPILNDLLKDKTSGVRAIMIYPLNALVNDQLERLRTLLKGTDIKFGRYTGELLKSHEDATRAHPDSPENEIISREQIHDHREIPQILITNYAMLEYLLLRPEDSVLFESGSWRYIVLDEAHTYSGAKGIEVGMLIDRLKHRLGKSLGDVRCIATSATLTNDDAHAATEFAESLFGESFEKSDIIFGDPDHEYARSQNPSPPIDPRTYLHEEFDALIKNVHRGQTPTESIATQMDSIGLIPPDFDMAHYSVKHAENSRGFVYEVMCNNHDVIELREQLLEHAAVEPSRFADEFFSGRLHEPRQCQEAFYRLVELGALARLEEDSSPLLPARYHMFMRSPEGIWICLNPGCNARQSPPDAKWSKVYSRHRETCDDCGCKVYHITVCRVCGQVYLQTIFNSDLFEKYHGTPNELTSPSKIRYFVWKELEQQHALGSEYEPETRENVTKGRDDHSTLDVQLCVRCGCGSTGDRASLRCACNDKSASVHIELKMLQTVTAKSKGTLEISPCVFIKNCPRCGDKAQPDTEIATPVNVRGSGPLSIIGYDFYRELPESPEAVVREKAGQGRKLLTFTDSRQGAARFASYFAHSVALDNYRYIVPTAINDFILRKEYRPDVEQLVPEIRKLAWSVGVPHNDPDSGFFRFGRVGNRMRRRDEDKLDIVVAQHLLGEITTGRLRRQSLESLSLVAVHYFDDAEPEFMPDFEALADQLEITSTRTRTLVEYLLDDLRKRKLLTMPRDVDPLDRTFGSNPGYPALVRGNPDRHQLTWHGTERHPRNSYIRLVLRSQGCRHDKNAIKDALNSIFEWLIASEVLVEVGTGTYRVDHRNLIFDTRSQWYKCAKCQRLHAHGPELPCPHKGCGGRVETVSDVDALQKDNYYYQSFNKPVVPIRIEEHTAQLKPDKGREYQNGFKRGDINVLSCSTTFEMGIDLGDLQAIVMRNVPPTVANYRQRSGRAGRRTGGAAFILTWTSERPHDQSYYRSPQDIINGKVRIPHIATDNEHIRRRHINAILLSEFLRYRKRNMGSTWPKEQSIGMYFDIQSTDDPHIDHVEKWAEEERSHIWKSLTAFACIDPDGHIEDFRKDIVRVGKRYSRLANYYQQRYDTAQQQLSEDHDRYMSDLSYYKKLRDRLPTEDFKAYLSNKGILPSYSFPIHTVELNLSSDLDSNSYRKSDSDLRLQRDLKVAIREFAPGSDVVADKRIWRSGRVWFHRGAPHVFEYRICEVCNGLQMSEEPGMSLPSHSRVCRECGHPSKGRPRKYVVPDGFFSDRKKSGKPVRQYVPMLPNVMKSALIVAGNTVFKSLTKDVDYAYDHDGELLYVNEGDSRFGGFRIHLDGDKRGLLAEGRERKNVSPISLGHRRKTYTLHLRFTSEQSPKNRAFWLSLMYALLHGACRALQIERRDIDGVLFPRQTDDRGGWQQTIVLYDDVPGGAGHVEQIREDFDAVVLSALNIAKCEDCAPDTSCYSCLRDYNNQLYHDILRRDEITYYLKELYENMAGKMV